VKVTTPWRAFWAEVDQALAEFEEAQAKNMNQYLKALRLAILKYGRAVDPQAFDEYGRPIEVDNQ